MVYAEPEAEAAVAVREEAAWWGEPGGDHRFTTFDDLADRIDATRFQEAGYTPVLRDMVARVIAQEAPIRDDALVERVSRAHGIRRSGRLVRERILALARGSAHAEAEPSGGGVFIWPDAASARTWTRARFPAGPQDCRPLEDIALAELGAALRTCASEDPAAEAARRFGVRRLTAQGRDRLARARPPSGHLY